MQRILVAFEAPDQTITGDVLEDSLSSASNFAEAWDAWVDWLASRGLELVADLDPVAVVGDLQVYEVVAK